MTCFVGSMNPVKIQATKHTLAQLPGLDDLIVKGISVPSGVADQPMTEQETRVGAMNRVDALLQMNVGKSEDWYIAIEGGVDNFAYGPATFAYVAIYHKGHWSIGRSANLPLPKAFYAKLEAGQELGDVMDNAFNTVNIKQKGGAIGLLTDNHASRQSVYEVALTLALAPFRYPELYNSKEV